MPRRRIDRYDVPRDLNWFGGMKARFETDCAICGDPIPIGAPIGHIGRHRGYAHTRCIYREKD